ncbi:MAG: hypothetical protein GY810_12485 [Aureispira sp.]|nr:hypothetical protein [Aureispira sp.]
MEVKKYVKNSLIISLLLSCILLVIVLIQFLFGTKEICFSGINIHLVQIGTGRKCIDANLENVDGLYFEFKYSITESTSMLGRVASNNTFIHDKIKSFDIILENNSGDTIVITEFLQNYVHSAIVDKYVGRLVGETGTIIDARKIACSGKDSKSQEICSTLKSIDNNMRITRGSHNSRETTYGVYCPDWVPGLNFSYKAYIGNIEFFKELYNRKNLLIFSYQLYDGFLLRLTSESNIKLENWTKIKTIIVFENGRTVEQKQVLN